MSERDTSKPAPKASRKRRQERAQQQRDVSRSEGRRTAAKGSASEGREDPEEYADPICVCEPEPYWQEIAEQLEHQSSTR